MSTILLDIIGSVLVLASIFTSLRSRFVSFLCASLAAVCYAGVGIRLHLYGLTVLCLIIAVATSSWIIRGSSNGETG